MLPAFLAAVEAVEPQAILMENVPGLVVPTRIHYLHELVQNLRSLGYYSSWRVLTASHYGVPQNRRRLFVIGLRCKPFWFPKPTHGPGTSQALVPASSVLSLDAPIGEPPACPVVYAKYPDLRPSPYAGQLYNGGGRPIDLNKPSPTMLASAGGYKTPWVDTLGMATKYHAHLMAGGEPWVGEVPGARRLTVEESALLQTFPRWLTFAGRRSSQYTQVGDAVPPMLASHLGRAVVAQMNGVSPDKHTHFEPSPSDDLLWTA